MDGGAALANQSPRRGHHVLISGAMLGYGVLASAARPGRAAQSMATNAKVLKLIVLTIAVH
jgi:hypothetical protein